MEPLPKRASEPRFISMETAQFFGAARNVQDLSKVDLIPKLFREAYPYVEATPKSIKNRVAELISFLNDPNSVKTDMGEKMIAGAFKVMDYLKGQVKTTAEDLEVKKIRSELESAKNNYLQNIVDTKISQQLGMHTSSSVLDPLRFYLSEHEEMLEKLRGFVDLCESLKLKNLEILGRHDGNVGNPADPEYQKATEEWTEIYVQLKTNPAQIELPKVEEKKNILQQFFSRTSSADQASTKKKSMTTEAELEQVLDILHTVFEGALLTNTQDYIDLFTGILPPEMRKDFPIQRYDSRQKSIQEKFQQTYMKYQQETDEKIQKIKDSNHSPEDKATAIQKAKSEMISKIEKGSDEWLYLPRTLNKIYEKDNWENVVFDSNNLFVAGDKVYGMMTADRERKIERHIPLDLSPLNMKSSKECQQSFELISLLLKVGLGNTEIFREWMGMKKGLTNQAEPTLDQLMRVCEREPMIREELDKLTALNNEQKRQLLAIGLEFSYRTMHFLRLARLELSMLN